MRILNQEEIVKFIVKQSENELHSVNDFILMARYARDPKNLSGVLFPSNVHQKRMQKACSVMSAIGVDCHSAEVKDLDDAAFQELIIDKLASISTQCDQEPKGPVVGG